VVCLCVPGCRGRKRRRVDEAGDERWASESAAPVQHTHNTVKYKATTKLQEDKQQDEEMLLLLPQQPLPLVA